MKNSAVITEYAKQLRHNQTKAETFLWQHLRAGRLAEYKFKRQYIIENYIADFYCAQAKLVIEIDGDDHYTEEHQEYDISRSQVMQSKGIQVLRYTNREVICELNRVLEDIYKHMLETIQISC